jgi:cell division protein FtsQ
MLTTLWIAIGAGTLVLLVAAVRIKDGKKCSGIYINIHGVNNNFFVDKKDVMNSITAIVGGNPVGEPVGSFDLEKMESGLATNVWIKSAQLFFDNNEMLKVNIVEREPIARIFTTVGTTFYIDSSIEMLPLSEKFSARLPVFTDFPGEKTDSNLLTGIKNISLAIQKDSFSMAMIDQVDITPQKTFELIPKMGNQVIEFGDATDIEDKLSKLQLFYKQVITKAGWSYYSLISLQYQGQVVAKRRGAEDRAADSLRTLQIMQAIAANAKKQSEDSVQTNDNDDNNTGDSSVIQQSTERDVKPVTVKTKAVAPTPPKTVKPNATQPKAAIPVTKPIIKLVVNKPAVVTLSPKEKVNQVTIIKDQHLTGKPVVKPPATIKKPVAADPKLKPVIVKPVKPKATTAAPKDKAQNDY